jgi:hypothetical protein
MANQRNFNRRHTHISGDFYDELEAAATLGQNCEITFQEEDGTEQKIISPIKDLFTENGAEFARLENRIIPLNSITSLNGKTVADGPIHTELLEQDRMPADAPYISPVDGQAPHEGAADDMYNTDSRADTHDNVFKGNIGALGNTGIPRVDNREIDTTGYSSTNPTETDLSSTHLDVTPVSTVKIHQNEVVEENLLGITDITHDTDTHKAIIIDTPEHGEHHPIEGHHAIIIDTPEQRAHTPQATTDDFVHNFTTSTNLFVVAENDLYHLSANRLSNRVELIVKKNWYNVNDNRELSANITRLAPLMASDCSLLIDLTALTPAEDGSIMSPAIGNKSALFNAGLTKVAELVPYKCETLVHGPDSFSVNSVRLRYFKDRMQAINWLSDDPGQIGTPDDMDLN